MAVIRSTTDTQTHKAGLARAALGAGCTADAAALVAADAGGAAFLEGHAEAGAVLSAVVAEEDVAGAAVVMWGAIVRTDGC